MSKATNISARALEKVLRSINLHPATGNGSGLDVWENSFGQRIKLLLRKKDVPVKVLFSISNSLENQGICTRKDFFAVLKKA